MTQYIFVYGTLRLKSLRRELLGHETLSLPGRLNGFSTGSVILDGIEYPIITENPDSKETINGEYFAVDEQDLEKIDAYESYAYRRNKVELENGIVAWVYIK